VGQANEALQAVVEEWDKNEDDRSADVPAETPIIGIINPDQGGALAMAAQVRLIDVRARVTILSLDERARDDVPQDSEVLLVDVTQGPAIVGFAASVLASRPTAHAVFLTDGRLRPEAEALRGLGAQYVLTHGQVWLWLEQALHPLSRHARARRQLAAAERAIPPAPAWDPLPELTLSLPAAEQRFRESYLRCVLSRSPSQKAAALLAGVPYTTLRSMVEKLLL